MLHSIISWDCSYRNFFHLIDALLSQDFPTYEFELIFVEQRNKDIANSYNHQLGLKSLEDRYTEAKDRINLRIIYLNHSNETPYHIGICNNEGIKNAKGDIITTMDGDQLLPSNFLSNLTKVHNNNPKVVVNILRNMCKYPIGVKNFKDWTKADIGYYRCLKSCPNQFKPIPSRVGNCGPMISSKKKFWIDTEGYDPHPIWGSSYSKLGIDVTRRLEIATNSQSFCLPNMFSIHPWHPVGGVRSSLEKASRIKDKVQKFFSIQDKLITWSLKNKNPKVSDRSEYTDLIYEKNKYLVEFIQDLSKNLENIKIDNKSIYPIRLNMLEKFLFNKYITLNTFLKEPNIRLQDKVKIITKYSYHILMYCLKVNNSRNPLNKFLEIKKNIIEPAIIKK